MVQLAKAVSQRRGSSGGESRAETLMSISTDGRIAEWSIKKGLSCSDLMVLAYPNEFFPRHGQHQHRNVRQRIKERW